MPAGKVAVGDAPSGITSRTSKATKSLSVPTCLGSIRETPEWPKETEFHIAERGFE